MDVTQSDPYVSVMLAKMPIPSTVIFPVPDRFSILVPYVPQKWYIWISFVVIYKTLSYKQIYSKQTFFRFQTCLHRWKCKHVWFSQFRMIFPVPDGFLKEAQNRGLKVRKCQFCRISIFYIYSFKLFILKVSKWPFNLFILSFTCALSLQWMKWCMVEWFSIVILWRNHVIFKTLYLHNHKQ